jgi:hypothetical protein
MGRAGAGPSGARREKKVTVAIAVACSVRFAVATVPGASGSGHGRALRLLSGVLRLRRLPSLEVILQQAVAVLVVAIARFGSPAQIPGRFEAPAPARTALPGISNAPVPARKRRRLF